MGDVIDLDVITHLDIPVEKIVENIPDDLLSIIVIGERGDGSRYFASSEASGPDCLWMLERAKQDLFELTDE